MPQSIGKAHAQIQEMRAEYNRLQAGQPQTAALTSLTESMEAAKEAVEHFCESKHRIHKIKLLLADAKMADAIPLLESNNFLDRLLDWPNSIARCVE